MIVPAVSPTINPAQVQRVTLKYPGRDGYTRQKIIASVTWLSYPETLAT